MADVIDFAEARRRRDDRHGKSAGWRFNLDADGELVITVFGPNGIEEDEFSFEAEASERVIEFLARKLRQRKNAEWRAANPPPPPPPPPKWKRCKVTPTGGISRGASGCTRREGHQGEHRDRAGVSFTSTACLHRSTCRVYPPQGPAFLKCNGCGKDLGLLTK